MQSLKTNLIENVEPLRIKVKHQNNLEQDFDLLIDQLRAIDNTRLTKGPIHKLDKELMDNVIKAVFEIVG